MKRCSKCGLVQPLQNFYKASGTRDGLRGDCKACFKARAKARYPQVREQAIERARRWQSENPDKVKAWREKDKASGRKAARDRDTYLKRKHGMTRADYAAMLAAQGGGCGVCGRPPRDDISLHIDHDHVTGRIRGLLCFRCNNCLGDLGDDPDLARRVVTYLEPVAPRSAALERRLAELKARSPAFSRAS